MSHVRRPNPSISRAAISTLFGGPAPTSTLLRRSTLLDQVQRPRKTLRLQPPVQRCPVVRDPMSPQAIRNLMRTLPGRNPAHESKTDIAGGVRRYGHAARTAAQHVERLYPRMRRLLNGIEPANLALAVAFKESTFSRTQINEGSGATGLMQVLPATARPLLANRALWPDLSQAQFAELSQDPNAALLRPEVALRVGLAVLAERIEARRGNLSLALADYNAGLVAVNRARGVPAIKETQDYVRLVPQYQVQVAEASRRIIG